MDNNSDYEHLIVTKYGTVKGDKSFREIKIEKFLKILEKAIHDFEININDADTLSIDGCSISVSRDSEDVYRIVDNYYTNSSSVDDEDDYDEDEDEDDEIKVWILTLNPKAESYQYLKNKLNILCGETKKNNNYIEVINSREKNPNDEKYNDKKSLKIYLKFLKTLKKYRRKLLGKSILKNPVVHYIVSLIPLSFLFGLNEGSLLLCMIVGVVSGIFDIFSVENSFSLFFKYLRFLKNAGMNREKIKSLEKELGKMQCLDVTKANGILASKEKEESNVPRINSGNKYKNATINRISYLFGVISDLPSDLYREAGLELMGYLKEALAIIQDDEQKNPEVRDADWWQDYIIVSVEVKLDLFENRINELLHPTGQQLTIVEGEELLKKMQAVFGEESPSSQTPASYKRKLVPKQNGQVANGH